MNAFIFDSRSPRCKTPFGAVPTDTPVTLSVYLPMNYQLRRPRLLLYLADRWDSPERSIRMTYVESDGISHCYRCTLNLPKPALYFYLFEVDGVNGPLRIDRDRDGFGRISPQGVDKWVLNVYDHEMRTPEFLKSGVMYQIFPDRFYRSGKEKVNVPADRKMHENWQDAPDYLPDENHEITNSDYFGGDLAGIQEKLPYLKSLGVSCIYLNPIFEAHSNHRYNTADFMRVDPLLGTENDLRSLCGEAWRQGIRIILDGVFNHTGSDSVYFNKQKRYGDGGAYNDPNSPYRSWYDFTNYPTDYQSWWGFLTLPNIRETEPSYMDYICGEKGVLQKWMDCGVSGFRLDVVDELPDEFLDRIAARIKHIEPQSAVIGEVWEDASTKSAYGVRRRYLLGGQLDSVMNYPFKDAILSYIRYGNCSQLYDTLMMILEHYPKPVLDVLMNSLSTHDVERAITQLAGEPLNGRDREWQGQNNWLSSGKYEKGCRLFRLASVIQYMLPGIPCLYYGDEAGLYGYRDPFNRATYPWGQADIGLIEVFQALGQIRTNYPGLSSGSFCAVAFTQEQVCFLRETAGMEFFVAVNRTELAIPSPIPPRFEGAEVLFGAHGKHTIAPYDCVVLARPLTP